MKSFLTVGAALLGFSNTLVNAAAVHVERMEMTRDTLEERQSPATCPSSGGNGPNSRHCWAPGFSKSSISRIEPLSRSDFASFLYRHVYLVAQHWRSCLLQSPDREHKYPDLSILSIDTFG
jgi:hypothetical protein